MAMIKSHAVTIQSYTHLLDDIPKASTLETVQRPAAANRRVVRFDFMVDVVVVVVVVSVSSRRIGIDDRCECELRAIRC